MQEHDGEEFTRFCEDERNVVYMRQTRVAEGGGEGGGDGHED